MVRWKDYLRLHCTFEEGEMDKSVLVKFWCRFFDLTNAGKCLSELYMSLLEEMIRGKTLKNPSTTTRLFAEYYREMLRLAGCLGSEEELLIDRYREALENDKIDISLLCTALGSEELEMNFWFDEVK